MTGHVGGFSLNRPHGWSPAENDTGINSSINELFEGLYIVKEYGKRLQSWVVEELKLSPDNVIHRCNCYNAISILQLPSILSIQSYLG